MITTTVDGKAGWLPAPTKRKEALFPLRARIKNIIVALPLLKREQVNIKDMT